MKKNQLLLLCGILTFCGLGCEDEDKPSNCKLAACDPGRKTVKQWVDEKGTIEFDQKDQMYVISVGKSPDIHILGYACNLPEEFKNERMQVVVSGELKEDCNELETIFVAQENYYLHIDTIEPFKD